MEHAFQKALETRKGTRIFQIKLKRMLDVSQKFGGIALIMNDITESKQLEERLSAMSLTDDLTGLYNRRGFITLSCQQMKVSDRTRKGMLLFFVDLDGLKWINDTLGHEEGDRALIKIATLFRETFRTSDIIARLGGDEYAALSLDISEKNPERFTARLHSLIEAQNSRENLRYRLSISVGHSYYDPENPCSIDELMSFADKMMYERKRNKKRLLLQEASLSSSNPSLQ
jgi:diguanylate cyclase (GGDEF)-like protein